MFFGKYKGDKVAIKMLFVMELTESSIKEFYKEAQILSSFTHDCIVECKGVTVLPPALGLVLEFCPNGSLFRWLYENPKQGVERRQSTATLRNARLRSRIDSSGGQSSRQRSTSSAVTQSRKSSLIALVGSLVKRRGNWTVDHNNEDSSFFVARNSECSTTRASSTVEMSQGSIVSDDPVILCRRSLEMMRNAASALAFMHSKGFMHCDIKSLNYLVTDVSLL